MKQTVNFYEFEKAFKLMNRQENFSGEGLRALFEYLENYEEEFDIELDIDVIAICCEFSEYTNFEEFRINYDIEDIEELEQNTTVIIINDDSFIIKDF